MCFTCGRHHPRRSAAPEPYFTLLYAKPLASLLDFIDINRSKFDEVTTIPYRNSLVQDVPSTESRVKKTIKGEAR